MLQFNFSLERYSELLALLKASGLPNLRFDEYLRGGASDEVVLLRHDVDRFPVRALRMAEVEHQAGLRASYYFRHSTFHPEIMKSLQDLGHEVGYHYENLSDSDGDYDAAVNDFVKKLVRFREVVSIQTISMHGKPLSRWNNLDLFRETGKLNRVKQDLQILGDVVLDIDYSGFAFISDTGRNFRNAHNHRDRVANALNVSFANLDEVKDAVRMKKFRKICIQFHPERWNAPGAEYMLQWSMDHLMIVAKSLVRQLK